MLQSRLIEALQDKESAAPRRRADAKASAARIVRGAIDDERGNDKERVERLAREAAERIAAEDFDALMSRPFGEAVAEICRDLGLSPDWLALAEDCAEAEARLDGKPGAAPGAEEPYRGRVEVCWLGEDQAGDSS